MDQKQRKKCIIKSLVMDSRRKKRKWKTRPIINQPVTRTESKRPWSASLPLVVRRPSMASALHVNGSRPAAEVVRPPYVLRLTDVVAAHSFVSCADRELTNHSPTLLAASEAAEAADAKAWGRRKMKETERKGGGAGTGVEGKAAYGNEISTSFLPSVPPPPLPNAAAFNDLHGLPRPFFHYFYVWKTAQPQLVSLSLPWQPTDRTGRRRRSKKAA
jgi:hypothetical protein